MSRKSRRDTLFGLKVLAISSAVVFMAAGVSGIYQDTKGRKVTSFSAKGVRIKTGQYTAITAESITAKPEPVLFLQRQGMIA